VAQTSLEKAVAYLNSNVSEYDITREDTKDMLISSEITSDKGITYLYLNQTVNGLPIHNAIFTVIIDKSGKVVHAASSFVKDAKSKVDQSNATLDAKSAILSAANHLDQKVRTQPIALGRSDKGFLEYEFAELVNSKIPVEEKYVLSGDKLLRVWNMNLDMKTSADYWDLNISANTGAFVSKHNYTVYCQHLKGAYDNHENCGVATFRNFNRAAKPVTQVAAEQKMGLTAAKYNVFKLPAESPNHGDRAIVSDDQYPQYSPFGWHDTNGVDGAEFTTTRGNNVHAYQDKNDDDESDGLDPEGGADLNFDFPIDLLQDPRESADASVTNLFYMVNMMHDVTALYGFDEKAGNFQAKNYTNISGSEDYVLAQAFDGISNHETAPSADNPKINNANFSTPRDGFNGRMQMFFWDNDGGSVSLDTPESLKGFIDEYGTGQFGQPIPENNEPAVSGKIVVARDGSTNPTSVCNAVVNGAEVTGNIALIDRGICEFSNKVLRAQRAGAIAAIICNIAGVDGGNGEAVIGMAGGAQGTSVTIPSIFLKKSTCDKIRLAIKNGEIVTMTLKKRGSSGSKYLDGALDNGVIAHEFGHGISNRLTGGPGNSGCLGNDEQMGEGWSDFFALIMTHEPEDKGSDRRGIGTYAASQTSQGGGIRRFPYSTDMTINPQTFKDIRGTTAPHPLGEVWNSMIWDMYWAFIDVYGYNPIMTDTTSGNYKAIYLVMEGMKIQNCNPGFIQGRDGIIAADKIHFGGKHECMLWDVFARRGLGFGSKGGTTVNRNDGEESFQGKATCVESLKISKSVTPSIDAGDEVSITLTAINHIKEDKNNIVITDELPAGMTYIQGSSSIPSKLVGDKVTFEVGKMDYDKPLTITYKAKSNITNKSKRVHYEGFDGDFNWDITKTEGSEDWIQDSDVVRSPEFSYEILNTAAENDAVLFSTPYLITGDNPALRFFHKYNTEEINDGGFVEIGEIGKGFAILPNSKFFRNGYSGGIAYNTFATPSLDGFSGASPDEVWVDSYADLSDYKGKEVIFRFRFGSNGTIAPVGGEFQGWVVDDFEIIDVYKYRSAACIGSDGGTQNQTCSQIVETIVDTDSQVATKNADKDYFGLVLSPNPASSYVNVIAKSPTSMTASVEVLNVDGISVYTNAMKLDNNVSVHSINTQSMTKGIYFVKIQSGSAISIKKLVIQ